MALSVFWQPAGINLDQLGTSQPSRDEDGNAKISDGDTPKVEVSIRMLSMDTPEKSVTARGLSKEEMLTFTPRLPNWFDSGLSPVPAPLAEHLRPLLERSTPIENHWEQGAQATEVLRKAMSERLTKPGGGERALFLRAADERFDRYGRLLAYVAPSYEWEERRNMTRYDRRTFNFQMVELGWAPTLIIYPSIPGELDLPMLQSAARTAIEEQRGLWADELSILAYEYRMLEKLVLILQKQESSEEIKIPQWNGWITRYCADIETGLLYKPTEYFRVAPWNRIFIWRDDVREAVSTLNIRPAQ